MYLNRRIIKVKPGNMPAVIELYKSLKGKSKTSSRLYACEFPSFQTVVIQVECESIAGYEKSINEFYSDPEMIAFNNQLLTLIDSGTNELWKFIDEIKVT